MTSGLLLLPHFVIPGLDQYVGRIDPFAPTNLIGLCGGLCWLALYVVAIRYGFKNRSFAIPQYAIPFNLAWEILTSFIIPNPIAVWMWVNRGWLAIDLIIAGQMLYYGRSQQTIPEIRQYFYVVFAMGLLIGLFAQYGYIATFKDSLGYEVAFVIDLVMSILFIFMYYQRRQACNMVFAIAWLKLFGNLGVSIQCYFLFPLIHPNLTSFAFFQFFYVALFVLDALYIGILWSARRSSSGSAVAASSS